MIPQGGVPASMGPINFQLQAEAEPLCEGCADWGYSQTQFLFIASELARAGTFIKPGLNNLVWIIVRINPSAISISIWGGSWGKR